MDLQTEQLSGLVRSLLSPVTHCRPSQLIFPPASLLLQLVDDELRPHLLADDQEGLFPPRGLVVGSPAHQAVLLGNNRDLLPLVVLKFRGERKILQFITGRVFPDNLLGLLSLNVVAVDGLAEPRPVKIFFKL